MLTELSSSDRRATGAEPGKERRLSQALFEKEQGGFLRFATLPSNVKGVEAAMLFSASLMPFVALVGPSGWGKTHLLEAVAGTLRATFGEAVRAHPASEWVASANRPETRALLLDDVTDVVTRTRARQQLRIVLERRVRAGRPTMLAFTATGATRALRSLLPCLREWTVGPVEAPSPCERETVVRHVATSNGLLLSETIVRLIATRASGNGRSICGALQRLKLVGTRWIGSEAVLRACGVLQPHLSDTAGWDLRDHVNEVICGSVQHSQKLGVYLMLHRMGLSEDEVARFYRLQPGEAYQAAMEFASACSDPNVLDDYRRCVETLVQSLESLEG